MSITEVYILTEEQLIQFIGGNRDINLSDAQKLQFQNNNQSQINQGQQSITPQQNPNQSNQPPNQNNQNLNPQPQYQNNLNPANPNNVYPPIGYPNNLQPINANQNNMYHNGNPNFVNPNNLNNSTYYNNAYQNNAINNNPYNNNPYNNNPYNNNNNGQGNPPNNQNNQNLQANQNDAQRIHNHAEAYRQFFETLPWVLVFYFLLMLACIILQYVVCGMKNSATIWITIMISIIVTLFLLKFSERQGNIKMVRGNLAFVVVQFILSIVAFALAVSHPPLLQYSQADLIEAGIELATSYSGSSYYSGYDYSYYSNYSYSSSSNDKTVNQNAGQCDIDSTIFVPSQSILKYKFPVQYICLVVYIVEFLFSMFFYGLFAKKSWIWSRLVIDPEVNQRENNIQIRPEIQIPDIRL